MAKYTVHAGHAAKGHLYTGAAGYCEESVEDRLIKDAVIKWLKTDGNLVSDCTVDSGLSASNIITKIKKKINAEQNVTANISIHLNASKKTKADGKTLGTECCIYSAPSTSAAIGERICKSISALGYKNRGNKIRTNLGVLKGITNGGANVLVECFFCDDEDDYKLYSKLGPDAIGKAIAEGIVGHSILAVQSTATSTATGKYVYNGVDYSPVFNAGYYATNNPDVKAALGTNEAKLFEHFYTFGMKEVRMAYSEFNPRIYRERYSDLNQVFGNDWPAYYKHYCEFGKKEGRKAI